MFHAHKRLRKKGYDKKSCLNLFKGWGEMRNILYHTQDERCKIKQIRKWFDEKREVLLLKALVNCNYYTCSYVVCLGRGGGGFYVVI